jgi:surface carbohydrate biosynthesis protein
MKSAQDKRVVILVDNRVRDLPGAALIAHHLRQQGAECFLEPIEAWRGVLAAHRPHLIVFNHLTASHLEQYSQRLHRMGVMTAVLLNEGILYEEGEMKFNAGKFHNQAHIDYYYCWNEPHRQALLAEGFGERTQIEVVGVPRFDFYVEPWSALYRPDKTGPRKRILCCTNFVTAKYWTLPREEADKFYAAWVGRIPAHNDYWAAIESHYNNRAALLRSMDRLLAETDHDLILRTHPNEEQAPYCQWYDDLASPVRARVTLDLDTAITTQILGCDLEISCETCTTAIESWIARKPTIEMVFDRRPIWHDSDHEAANLPCASSEELPGMVNRVLAEFDPAHPPPRRAAHLEKWCHQVDGGASARVANHLAHALGQASEPDFGALTAPDHRRAAKLKVLRFLGLPYHFDPLLRLKAWLQPRRYTVKSQAYAKSIRPREVARVQEQIESLDAG